tara:strand:+ start:33590 stop:34009 length:420 start_codon:yes stop_codon:yes gene_type:complete
MLEVYMSYSKSMIREVKEAYLNEQGIGSIFGGGGGGGGGDAGVSLDPDALTVKFFKGGKPAGAMGGTEMQVTNLGPTVQQAVTTGVGTAYDKFATSLSDPANLAKIGAGVLAGGALVGGGLALGRRLGNIGRKKKERNV